MTGVVLKMEGWRHGSVVVHVGEHTVAHVCALIKLHLNYGHLLWEGGREEGGRKGERERGRKGRLDLHVHVVQMKLVYYYSLSTSLLNLNVHVHVQKTIQSLSMQEQYMWRHEYLPILGLPASLTWLSSI